MTTFDPQGGPPQEFDYDSKSGRAGDFGHWAGVQRELIEAPLEDISSQFRTSHITSRVSKELVSTLMQAMEMQLRASASHFNLNVRMAEDEIRTLEAFLDATEGEPDDEHISLESDTIKNPSLTHMPGTRNEALNRIDDCGDVIDHFVERIKVAKSKNAYYDICPLMIWHSQPQGTRGSPESLLPFFGKQLWYVLNMDSQGLALSHRQAIGAHMISAELGGALEGEVERTSTQHMVDRIFGKRGAGDVQV